jgi:hypothetical protein
MAAALQAVDVRYCYEVEASRRFREHSAAMNDCYTILPNNIFDLFDDAKQALIFSYLLSCPPRYHPSERQMATELGMGVDKLKEGLDGLLDRGVVFRDWLACNNSHKSVWHLSHPCQWMAGVAWSDSIDPHQYQSSILTGTIVRINQAKGYFLSRQNTYRIPNLLFKIGVRWRAKVLYLLLCSLPDTEHPSVAYLSQRTDFAWQTVRDHVDALHDANMIRVEELENRVFGGWHKLNYHLTHCYFWACAAAKKLYSPPKQSRLTSLPLLAADPSWQIERQVYSIDAESASSSYKDWVRTTENQVRMTENQVRTTKESPEDAQLEALARKGSGPCKKNMKEEAVTGEHRRSSSRAISIAKSAEHVWTKNRDAKYDWRLWADTIAELIEATDEREARNFCLWLDRVYKARGCKTMAYKSLAMDDLRIAFMDGILPRVFVDPDRNPPAAAGNPALECEKMAHTSHSRENCHLTVVSSEQPDGRSGVESLSSDEVSAAPAHELESLDVVPVPSDKDPLADLPTDEIRQRWIVHRMWPKMGKILKSKLQSLWSSTPDQALRLFGAKEMALVTAAAADLLNVGILRDADVPPLPWENQSTLVIPSANPHVVLLAEIAKRQEMMAAGKIAESDAPLTRARLDHAFMLLAKDLKFNDRFRMRQRLDAMSDKNFHLHLVATYGVERTQEVLDGIP